MTFHSDRYWVLFYLIYIYINDLHKCTTNFDKINYADDTTLKSTINQFDNHRTGMNDNNNKKLRNVHNWLLSQRQSFNVSITKLMMFHMPHKNVSSVRLSICNLKIEEVYHFNFLGLIIDNNMSATLAQWGERSLSERTAQVIFPVRPDKTYTVFCWQECPYKMNSFRDYSVYLCI